MENHGKIKILKINTAHVQIVEEIETETNPGKQKPCNGIYAIYMDVLTSNGGRYMGFANESFHGMTGSGEKNRLAAKSFFSEYMRELGAPEKDIHTHLVEWYPKKE